MGLRFAKKIVSHAIVFNKMTINISPDKHVALLFEARSGSTILRQYLAEVTARTDLNEFFNHYVAH